MTTIGITLGDPAGIGPEIIIKSADYLKNLPIKTIIYGSRESLKKTAEILKIPVSEDLNIVESGDPGDFKLGQTSINTGKVQIDFLKKAVEDARRGIINAIVTLPVNKKAISMTGLAFNGHTEFLADQFKIRNFAMMFACKDFSIVLATTHIPIKDVPKKITKNLILDKLRLIRQHFPEETIAVCGLNPHCGEDGLMGHEEKETIIPALKLAADEGIRIAGLFPADVVFQKAIRGEFKVVLCMYHDQGLIPAKLWGFENCVNVTLGLPIIRTSVTHGTAYDIAGKGIARNESFKKAVEYAIELARRKHDRR